MKIGLLTNTELSEFRLNTLKPILRDNSFSIELAVIDDSPKKSIYQKIKKNLKKGRGGYIIIMAYQSLFAKKEIEISTENFCEENRISILKTKDIYSSETIDKIRSKNLDILLLIGGYGIIKEPLLTLTPFGILSYHHGNMRKFRGQPPALWELYNNETEMGITVQILVSGLDCGIPVEEKTIEIMKNDTLIRLQNRSMCESVNMMYEALKKLNSPGFIPLQIESFGRVYTIPNLRQFIILNLKILWRRLKQVL
jgi:methionyl-tRNA formyltransferase